jgi:antitoxin MazE
MKTHVSKWGNSLAIRIPKALAIELGLREGTAVDVTSEPGRLVITPATGTGRRKYSLKEILRGIRPEHLHSEVDFGPPVGKEIW